MKNLFVIAISTLLCTTQVSAQLQQTIVSGHVTTSDGQPAAYVKVFIKETGKSLFTDQNGSFSIKTEGLQSCTIIVKQIGLKTEEKSITLDGGKTEVSFQLQESSSDLDEVTVSGVRNPNLMPSSVDKSGLDPMDVPQSIAVVTSKVITDQQDNRLGEVIKNVSGVSQTQTRGGVAETFSARGYSIGIAGGGGSILKNGSITNTAGFPEASTLESVEVIKGSSALMYGNTSGGVLINMVTKKPRFDKGSELSMRAGSYNFYKPIVDFYGPLSQNLAYRVVGTYENTNSYRDNVKSSRTYINPSLLYKLGKKTTILLQGDYLNNDFTPDFGIGVLNNKMNVEIPASRSRYIGAVWAYEHLKQSSASVNINHEINSNWSTNLIASFAQTNVDAFSTNAPMTISSNGDYTRTLSRTKTFEKDLSIQWNLKGKFNTGFLKHQALFGADAQRVTTGTNAFSFYNLGKDTTAYDVINILDPNKYTARTDMPGSKAIKLTTSPSDRIGVYVQDLISITDKFKILAGVRWSDIITEQTSIQDLVTGVQTKGATATTNYTAISPKASLIYQPLKTTSIYASYANNFTANTGIDIYGNALKPSIINQYEAGVKNELLDGKMSANVSVYHIENSKLYQMAIFDANGKQNNNSSIKQLSGATTSDGFELDVTGVITKNTYFIAGYGYNNARYTSSTGDSLSVVKGDPLINNPRNTVNATIFYEFDKSALKGLKLGAGAFYTGKRFGGNQNTVDQAGDYNRMIPLTGFATIDFSAGYTYQKISLLVKVSNITNTLNYLVHDRYSINPIPPRMLMATLSYKFK